MVSIKMLALSSCCKICKVNLAHWAALSLINSEFRKRDEKNWKLSSNMARKLGNSLYHQK
jgi:hypothetical protein